MTGLIMGVTGAGKTTLLNAIATLLRPTIKIVTIEDTPELRLTHENWVQLYSRPSYGFEAGLAEITLYDLVRVSLRYRPDVLIVGEVRGEEAKVLFQAVASVSWDTPILIRNSVTGEISIVPIGEFVDKYYLPGEERIVKEVDGYEVLSHDGFKAVWKPIKYVLRHSADEIYLIEAEGGLKLEATGNHSVFVLDEETLAIKEKKVEDLTVDDLLLSFNGIMNGETKGQHNIEVNINETASKGLVALQQLRGHVRSNMEGVHLDEEMGFLLGVYIADGCVKKHRGKRVCFTMGSTEEHLMNKLMSIIRKKFGLKPYIDDRGTYKILEYNSTKFAILIEQIAGRKLTEKHVPIQLYQADLDTVKAFFEGLSADARRTEKAHRYLNIVTANRNLAIQLIWLARLHGIPAYMREEPGTGKNEGRVYYNIYLYINKEYKKPDASEKVPVKAILKLLSLVGIRYLPLRYHYIKKRRFISRKTAKKILKWINSKVELEGEALILFNRINQLINGNLHPIKVKKIRKVKNRYKYVYDISVPETESFFGGNIPVLLHNTGHGGITTIHAEHIDAAVKRLTSPPMDIPPGYIPLVNFALAIKRVRLPTGAGTHRIVRRVTEVWEIRDYEDYPLVARWDPASREHYLNLEESILIPRIAEMTGQEVSEVIEDIKMRETVLRWMAVKGVTKYEEVSARIMEYYRRPEKVFREAYKELERLERYT